MAKQHLLLVDGDAKSLRVLEVSLRKAGFSVATAANGLEALEQCEARAPDLVLSDTRMPGMDGLELCRRLKADPRFQHVPFLFLSAQKSVEARVKGLELGAEDYLTKPIYVKEVVARVRLLLQKREKEQLSRHDGERGLAGSLADMGIVDLAQAFELGRKTGTLHLAGRHGQRGAVYFRDGRVVDAELGNLRAERAFYRLLDWNEGAFRLEFQDHRRPERIALATQPLLLEGMRRVDEWGRLAEGLPPLATRCEVDYGVLAGQVEELPEGILALLRLFDGKRDLERVVEEAGLDELETLAAIGKLLAEGLIRPVPSEAPAVDRGSVEGWLRDGGEFVPGPASRGAPAVTAWFAGPDGAAAGIDPPAAPRSAPAPVPPVPGRETPPPLPPAGVPMAPPEGGSWEGPSPWSEAAAEPRTSPRNLPAGAPVAAGPAPRPIPLVDVIEEGSPGAGAPTPTAPETWPAAEGPGAPAETGDAPAAAVPEADPFFAASDGDAGDAPAAAPEADPFFAAPDGDAGDALAAAAPEADPFFVPPGGDAGDALAPAAPDADPFFAPDGDAGDGLDDFEAGLKRKHRWPWVAAVAGLALVVGVVGLVVLSSDEEETPPAPAPAPGPQAAAPEPPAPAPAPAADLPLPEAYTKAMAAGRESLDAGAPRVAIAEFQNAVTVRPTADAYAGLAEALIDAADFGGALEAANKAIGLDPAHARAHGFRGFALQLLEEPDYPEAVKAYERALELAPDAAEAVEYRRMIGMLK